MSLSHQNFQCLITITVPTKGRSHSKTVQATQNINASLQSTDQNGDCQPAGSSPGNAKSNIYSVAVARWLEAHCHRNKASVSFNENLCNKPWMTKGSCDKSLVGIKKTCQPGKEMDMQT